MGYKVLGFIVWRVGKWYLRRRFPSSGRRNVALAGAGALAVLGFGAALASQRRSGNAAS